MYQHIILFIMLLLFDLLFILHVVIYLFCNSLFGNYVMIWICQVIILYRWWLYLERHISVLRWRLQCEGSCRSWHEHNWRRGKMFDWHKSTLLPICSTWPLKLCMCKLCTHRKNKGNESFIFQPFLLLYTRMHIVRKVIKS